MAARKPTLRDVAERNALVMEHQQTVRIIAAKYLKTGVDFDDLVAAGQLGLIRAAEVWPPDTGEFDSYACESIKGTILKLVRETTCAVTISSVAIGAVRGYRPALKPELMEAAHRALAAERCNYEVALDSHHMSSAHAGPKQVDDRDEVDFLLRDLPEQEANVLRLRYGLDGGGERTQVEIARSLGVSRDIVGYRERQAVKRLRAMAAS